MVHPYSESLMLTIAAVALLVLGVPARPDSVVHGIDPANLDTTCAPCQDFYQFATGGWTKSHPIPAAFPRWGSFDELAERNRLVLRDVLEAAVRDTARKWGLDEVIGAREGLQLQL